MALANGADAVIGGIPVKLDDAAPEEIQRPAYDHNFQPIFNQRIDITGKPGAQNLRSDRLLWHITDWAGGEGQVVLDNSSDASARRFFRSEGLDFRVPGQVTLNKSVQRNSPIDSSGGATASVAGSAFTALSGSITDTGTDTELNSTGTTAESTSVTPGVGQTTMAFKLYKAAAVQTTIEASAFIKEQGQCPVSGSDRIVPGFSGGQNGFGSMRSANLVSGTAFTAGVPVTVTFSGTTPSHTGFATVTVFRGTSGGNRTKITETDGPLGTGFPVSITFTPQGTNTYHFHLSVVKTTPGDVTVDKLTYSASEAPTNVTVRIVNETDGGTVTSKNIDISNTTSAQVTTLTWNSIAAKEYRARVIYNSGAQHPFIDEVVSTVNTTTALEFHAMELGLNGDVWLLKSTTSVDPTSVHYDFTNEDWDAHDTLADPAAASDCRALAHTDAYQYGLFSDGLIAYWTTTAGNDHDYVAAVTGGVGIAICQNRLFYLVEASTGVTVNTYAVDTASGSTPVSALQTATVSSAVITSDATLRERMCATPTGARFFVNYGSDSVIYEADASGSTLVIRELARLDRGAKVTAIDHVAGFTFMAVQFKAETGETARCALYVMDQANTPRRVGYFRRDDPSTAPVVSMQAYQNDLWLLQGEFIWRYSLQTGGLYCEYELDPGLNTYARQIAVVQGHVFAMYESEDATNTGGVVHVAGSVGTYRQSSLSDGSSFDTSIYDYGLPGEKKTLRSVTVLTDDMPDDTSVVVQAQVDQDGTWIDIGSHTTGAESTFTVSTSESSTDFRTIQMRVILNSATGVSTPILKAIIVEAMVLGFEEFFDLVVLTDDEDPAFHIADHNRTGGEVTQALNALRRAGAPFSFIDGREHKELGNNPEYTCVFDSSRDSNDDVGEGRYSLRLRVL